MHIPGAVIAEEVSMSVLSYKDFSGKPEPKPAPPLEPPGSRFRLATAQAGNALYNGTFGHPHGY